MKNSSRIRIVETGIIIFTMVMIGVLLLVGSTAAQYEDHYDESRDDDEWIGFVFICVLIIVIFIISIVIAIWVYRDANSRGMDGTIWLIVVFVGSIVGLIVYLIIRKDHPVGSPPSGGNSFFGSRRSQAHQPVQYPPMGYPPGAYPPVYPQAPVQYPPMGYPPAYGQYSPGPYPPGSYPQASYPPAQYPPDTYPSAGYPPGAYGSSQAQDPQSSHSKDAEKVPPSSHSEDAGKVPPSSHSEEIDQDASAK